MLNVVLEPHGFLLQICLRERPPSARCRNVSALENPVTAVAGSAGLHSQRKYVADPALGPDDFRGSRVNLQLAPQPQHLDIDATVEHVFVYAGRLQEVLAAQWALRGIEEGDQQRVFSLGQSDRSAVTVGQPPRAAIQPPAAESATGALRITLQGGMASFPTPQHGANTRKKLAQAKWLGDVVIRPELKSNHPIDLVTPMAGDDYHRHVRVRPGLAQEVESVLLPQLEVENHEAGLPLRELPRGILTLRGRGHGQSLLLEVTRDHMAHRGVIIDHENVRGPTAFSLCAVLPTRRRERGVAAERTCFIGHRTILVARGGCHCLHNCRRRASPDHADSGNEGTVSVTPITSI